MIKNKHEKITGFKPLSTAKNGDISFCVARGKNGIKQILSSKASVILCDTSLKNQISKSDSNLIFVDRPRMWFLLCMKKFYPLEICRSIHPTSIIESKKRGKNIHIGPFSYVGKDVVIGDNTIIHGNVSIYGNTRIGKNVTIDSSTVIGADGFGFEKNDLLMKWEKFPHIGGIEIGDDVEIGANVCIDRGTLENTIIGEGTKIDNLVHIAHNVKIGKNCLIVAQSLIGGSCVIEDDCYVAMCAVLRDGIKLKKNSIVGMGAVVTKDVQAGQIVAGVPARPIKSSVRMGQN